ncbi:1,4-dihydroxy-2-naphthoate octaprenyltransferase [Prevotella sp. oral taxon 376]|uniref:1,4-dihydroxy-2-naphthoate octaprenyltransferase n=1 Tax=Prevotella sp. oral taxon 376 TaxID=712466 RepID=UPI000D1DE127|nr:1,4-dihydroxy-2-naphthoate octaprenyltransferase [Prevotella sp. oral taxon 376]PTL32815.1 1,4-dihydroxy-2-naphthoate octaprenyltransferase [Prevotella sp. oral taxon 376]
MNENDIQTNSPKSWLLAARPKTLTGAAVPVMIGSALALKDAGIAAFQLIPAILSFLFAFIMQIDANFVNDYFDYKHGNDDRATRLGPKRACAEGWITPHAMRKGIAATSLLACVTGLPLVVYGGPQMLLVGIACVLFCFLYTTILSYWGLGDVLVLLFFGIIPVCCTYYVILPENLQNITIEVFLASVACGFVIDTLLLVNNYRDRNNDKRDHKITLVVRIGYRNAERLYLWVGFIGVLIMAGIYLHEFNLQGRSSTFAAMALLLPYLFRHQSTQRQMCRIREGRELNQILGQTARNMLVYGVGTALGILLLS